MDELEAAYVRRIEAENEQLRERVAQLEELVIEDLTSRTPIELELTIHEAALVGFLMKRTEASKEQLLTAIYGHLPSGDEPEIKIIDVFVCKARKKLKKFGIEVKTLWGRGYMMPPAAKSALRAMTTRRQADEAA
jgi:two-component system cell cycle response regulator CtrA